MATRRAFLAGLGVAAAAWAGGSSVARAAIPAPGGMRRWAAERGGRWVWIERNKVGEIRMPDGRVARLTVERRDIEVAGTKVWLGAPVVAVDGDLQLGPGDAEAIVGPLLVPVLAGVPWRRLALDAGHGGRDRGTQNPDHGWQEKALVLDLSQRLARQLEGRGRQVLMIRTDDRFIPLEERPARAAAGGADLFVSLHLNAGPPPVSGVETFVLPPAGQPSTGRADVQPGDHEVLPGNRFDLDNTRLGFALQDRLRLRSGSLDRGLRRARFAVLRTLHCPGALVEAGFLSHPEEGRRLAHPDYRERLAAWLAEALLAFRLSPR